MKISRKLSYLIIFVIIICGVLAIRSYLVSEQKHRKVLMFMPTHPFSADPMDFDSFYHHVAFGSVFGNLVTQYKVGEHTPEIAKSWSVSADQTEWKFYFRDDMTYSDGSKITPSSYAASLLRIAKIMKNKKSDSGVFEKMVGFDSITNTSDKIDGLTYDQESLTIKFNKPMPRLLEKISFGLYVATHDSLYDKQTGNWTAGRQNVISSGPYKITDWSDDHFVLKLRADYPKDLLHKNPIEEIEIFWKKESHQNSEIDIAMGSEVTESPGKDYVLQAGVPSDIMFMRVLSWRDKNSFFHDKKNRIAYRNQFYQKLEQVGFKPVRSFFPLIVNGVSELNDPPTPVVDSQKTAKVRIPIYTQPAFPNYLFIKTIDSALAAAEQMQVATERSPLNFQLLLSEVANEKENPSWDLVRYGTAILASEPEADVKFMFRSKEGLFLPDETGEILNELKQKPLNLQRINQLLWDQGLIWPVKHYASGLWARPDLDFSQINLVLPSTKFQWIGWK